MTHFLGGLRGSPATEKSHTHSAQLTPRVSNIQQQVETTEHEISRSQGSLLRNNARFDCFCTALKWGNRPGCHWQAGGLPHFVSPLYPPGRGQVEVLSEMTGGRWPY